MVAQPQCAVVQSLKSFIYLRLDLHVDNNQKKRVMYVRFNINNEIEISIPTMLQARTQFRLAEIRLK